MRSVKSHGCAMIEFHLRKLRARDDISAAEEAAIRSLIGDVVKVPAHKTIIRSWTELHESTLLFEGWTARAKDLETGARQLTELNIAGDFVDLHSFTLKQLDHEIVTLTECTLAAVPHDRLQEVTASYPHLARVFWFSTNMDAAIHREWMLSMGRRSAISRTAHLFCEMLVRLGVIGLADPSGYDFPLTQTQLADCLGMTPVHVNRTLQNLRQAGLIRLENRRLEILNLPELKRVAEFDPAYLYLSKRSR